MNIKDNINSELNTESSSNQSMAVDAARITGRYNFYTSVIKYALLFGAAAIALFLFAPTQPTSSQFIGQYVVKAFSGDEIAKQRLMQLSTQTNELSDKNADETEKLDLIAKFLQTAPPIVVIPEPEPVVVVADPVIEKPKVVVVRKPPKILLYGKAVLDAGVVTSVVGADELKIITPGPEWTKVSLEKGLPVWVFKEFVEPIKSGYVKITANGLKARSAPNLTDSHVMGLIYRNTELQVIRNTEEWVRVWSPVDFTAWVQTAKMLENKE